MRVLVVGDSFMSAEVFHEGLRLPAGADVEFIQVDESRTPAELPVREYAGDPQDIAAHMNGVEVLVVHGAPVTGDVLDASDRLRLVCCARGGPVNVDVAAASERGVPVATTPGKNAESVADQTLAFMVMLARRFPQAQRFLLDGGTTNESAFEGRRFLGHDLAGHTLGLVGYGNVGRRVARRARAFDMSIAVYDPYLGADGNGRVDRADDLHTLLSRADFVSLHARATPENENLMDGEAFAAMRDGAYFVNTARETLVDEDALDAALTGGHVAGAALDVVRPRPPGSGPHPLLRHRNVVLTPHIGGATHETLLRGARMLSREIERFAAGQPPLNLINRQAVG